MAYCKCVRVVKRSKSSRVTNDLGCDNNNAEITYYVESTQIHTHTHTHKYLEKFNILDATFKF